MLHIIGGLVFSYSQGNAIYNAARSGGITIETTTIYGQMDPSTRLWNDYYNKGFKWKYDTSLLIKYRMKKSNYWKITGFSLMILVGIALYYYIGNSFKDYSIVIVAFGLLGLIKLIKNPMLRFILFLILLIITIIALCL